MKKIISLILAVLMIFSATAFAFAADEANPNPENKPIKITFVYDVTDRSGLPVRTSSDIYVDYGEDFNDQVPESSYYTDTKDGKYRVYIGFWTTDKAGYNITNWKKGSFVAFPEGSSVTEITFEAQPATEKVTAGNTIGGASEDLFGINIVELFAKFFEQFKVWFAEIILLLGNFM